ncbi:hypothetical protein RA086_07860 [Lactiplantibacillus sp. WILCCON 0030]|uniref:ABC transporter permease n=1 Tax=Lactiplantibacillus brownii TaxID=3069269 RepID=A0ABU1A9K3_9LACO|nr:hypothetical protein [Lactiplantibacillus brownii]MDQ7937543.1 hypothetical protein [Lactiplantibacillus brownii]
MTFKQVNRLWWSQSWHWLLGFVAVILLIGMGTAVKTTQLQAQQVQQTPQLRISQAQDYQKHPENYRLNGKQVTLAAYWVAQNQFFQKDQFKVHDYQLRTDVAPNVWFYLVTLIVGLILAFWGRRTHYAELLFSLGVTRTQLFVTQLGQGLAVVASVLVAQMLHWLWIILVIPERYQIYRDLPGLIENSLVVVMISLGLLILGWFMGQLTDRFWLAGLLAGLSWRFIAGLWSNAGYAALFFGEEAASPESWVDAHAVVTSGIIAGVTLVGIGLIWRLSLTWSAERTGAYRPTGLQQWLLVGVMTIAGGSLIGDFLLRPFMMSVLPWYEIIGMIVLLGILLVGVNYQRYRSVEVRHGA